MKKMHTIIGANNMSRKTILGIFLALFVLAAFISCDNILSSPNKGDKGAIALSIPRMADWLHMDSQVPSEARALAFATSVSVEIKT